MEDENMKLLTFPVKVEDGGVFLDLPPTAELDQVTKAPVFIGAFVTFHDVLKHLSCSVLL